MKRVELLQSEKSAGAKARCEGIPPKPISVVNDQLDLQQVDAKVANRVNFQSETAEGGAVARGALQANGYDLRIGKANRPLPCRADRKEIIEQAKLVLAEAQAIAELVDHSFALRFAERRAECTNESVSGFIEPRP